MALEMWDFSWIKLGVVPPVASCFTLLPSTPLHSIPLPIPQHFSSCRGCYVSALFFEGFEGV